MSKMAINWHIELADDTSRLTTFNTGMDYTNGKDALWIIAPAPEIFQKRLDVALQVLSGVFTIAPCCW